MEITEQATESLIEYGLNNRLHSEQQIERICKSIKEFGFNQPVVVDEENVILVGHGRVAAAKRLGLKTVPVLVKSGLSDNQKRAYRILDNKLQNDSEWDLENLRIEMERLAQEDYPIEAWGLESLIALYEQEKITTGENGEEKYTKKIEPPIYKPTGERPQPSELCNVSKCEELSAEIENTKDLDEELRQFLLYAAQRHVVFNYQKIAEFYAHAPAEVQRLMEDSALVIIDFRKAIEQGFVKLTQDLSEVYKDDAC